MNIYEYETSPFIKKFNEKNLLKAHLYIYGTA